MFYKFLGSWLPLIFWMSLIFYISSIPDLTPGFSSDGANIFFSKLAHIAEYAILTALLIRAFGGKNSGFSFQSVLQLAFLTALLYAVSDEYHQLFVQGREGTFRDVVIDAIGITFIPLWFTKNKRPQNMRSQDR